MLQGLINKVKNYLSKTSIKLNSSFANIFKNKKIDVTSLEELKEALISTDVDYQTASLLIEQLSSKKFEAEVTDKEVKEFLASKIVEILLPMEGQFQFTNNLQILIFCGVNGNGKTTTIAKLAHKFKSQGKKIMVASCDTFRAAAEEQLTIWMQRIGVEVFAAQNIKDPASVAYQAIAKAKQEGCNLLFIDTAGRLHTNTDLMNELKKIISVVRKSTGDLCSFNTVLVLDATVGQNSFNQIKLFKEVVEIDGLIITKLDGTAKAGALIGIANQFKDLKLYYIGVGEDLDDVQPFSAVKFTRNLLGIECDSE